MRRASSSLAPVPSHPPSLSMMHLRQAPLLFLTLLACAWLVASQNAPDEVQVNPNAQCKQEVRDQITSCLDQVEQDESKLKTGPCLALTGSICTKQQGMVDCYSECPGLQPVDMIKFNGNNCKGQHGQTLKAEGGDLTYTWSTLPFTSTGTEPPSIIQSSDAAAPQNASTADSSASTAESSVESTSTSPTVANTTVLSKQISTQPSSASSNTSTIASTSSTAGAAGSLSANRKVFTDIVAAAISLLSLWLL